MCVTFGVMNHAGVHLNALGCNKLFGIDPLQSLAASLTHCHVDAAATDHFGQPYIASILIQGDVEIALGKIACRQTADLFWSKSVDDLIPIKKNKTVLFIYQSRAAYRNLFALIIRFFFLRHIFFLIYFYSKKTLWIVFSTNKY